MTIETAERAAQRNLIAVTFQNVFHVPFTVDYDDDAETIHARSFDDAHAYTMFIASDDDVHLFMSDVDDRLIVRFPLQ